MNNTTKYYEIVFNDEEGNSICIIGKRKPTIEEANIFCKKDCEFFKAEVKQVLEIDKEEAFYWFNMDNENDLPIFE